MQEGLQPVATVGDPLDAHAKVVWHSKPAAGAKLYTADQLKQAETAALERAWRTCLAEADKNECAFEPVCEREARHIASLIQALIEEARKG